MRPLDDHPDIARNVQALRVITYILTLTLALFLGMAAFLHYGAGYDEVPEDAGLLTNLALLVGGAAILIVAAFRSHLMARALEAWKAGDPATFAQRYGSGILVALVAMSGAGFLMGVAFLIEKDPMTLTAGVLCVLAILANVPSPNRVNNMLEALA